MKKSFKGLALALVLVLALVALTGCGNSKGNEATATTAPAATEAPVAEVAATDAPVAEVAATDAPAAEAAPAGDDALVGEWKDEVSGAVEYKFTADGKTAQSMSGVEVMAGTYTVAGDKLSAVYETAGVKMPAMEMAYKIEGDKLTLNIQGVEMVFVKK